jgi:MoxR-like ATPase
MAELPPPPGVTSVGDVAAALQAHGYLADTGLATSIFLAMRLRRPLLLEGEAGVGKTEVAKVLARWTGGELIRLQCYEGIDASQAVYEWDYSRQLLHLRAAEATGEATGAGADKLEDELRFHLEMRERHYGAAGLPADAVYADADVTDEKARTRLTLGMSRPSS